MNKLLSAVIGLSLIGGTNASVFDKFIPAPSFEINESAQFLQDGRKYIAVMQFRYANNDVELTLTCTENYNATINYRIKSYSSRGHENYLAIHGINGNKIAGYSSLPSIREAVNESQPFTINAKMENEKGYARDVDLNITFTNAGTIDTLTKSCEGQAKADRIARAEKSAADRKSRTEAAKQAEIEKRKQAKYQAGVEKRAKIAREKQKQLEHDKAVAYTNKLQSNVGVDLVYSKAISIDYAVKQAKSRELLKGEAFSVKAGNYSISQVMGNGSYLLTSDSDLKALPIIVHGAGDAFEGEGIERLAVVLEYRGTTTYKTVMGSGKQALVFNTLM